MQPARQRASAPLDPWTGPPDSSRSLFPRPTLGGFPGTPPRCVSNCSTVTSSYRLSIFPFNSGKTSAMVVSQRSFPSSMNIAASVAVMDLVQEPIWNWSLVVTRVGRRSSERRPPRDRRSSRLSRPPRRARGNRISSE